MCDGREYHNQAELARNRSLLLREMERRIQEMSVRHRDSHENAFWLSQVVIADVRIPSRLRAARQMPT